MFRQSIYENKDRYNEAVKKVISLKEQGLKEEEIPNNLSSFFQEKEITSLLKDLGKLPTLNGNIKLKSMLKISLWILLIIKFITIPVIISSIEISLIWKLFMFLLSLLIIGLALYYTYKENYDAVFLIIFISLALSSDTFIDNIKYLFTNSFSLIPWSIGLISTVSFLIALYCSWILRRIYSKRLLNLKEIIKKEKLSFI